jgi:hypothetical protein
LITHFSTSIPAKKSSTKIFFIIQLEENKKAPEFIRTGSTKSLSEQVQQSIISFLFFKKKKMASVDGPTHFTLLLANPNSSKT